MKNTQMQNKNTDLRNAHSSQFLTIMTFDEALIAELEKKEPTI